MSKHTIYPEFEDQIHSRWKKTTVHALAGTRIDPYHPDMRIPFLLMSAEKNFNHETRVLQFDYETDVIELYSERESRLFKSLNRVHLESGKLIPYEESAPEVNEANTLTDTDIMRILLLQNRLSFRKRLSEINSPITLRRIKELLTSDHKAWYTEEIDARVATIDTEYQ
jgi:hypothetical protein